MMMGEEEVGIQKKYKICEMLTFAFIMNFEILLGLRTGISENGAVGQYFAMSLLATSAGGWSSERSEWKLTKREREREPRVG